MMMKTPQVRFPQVEEGVARTMQLYLQLAPTYLSPPCSIHHLVVAVALKVSRITPVGTEDSPFDLLTCTIAVSLLLQCCRIRYCDVLAACIMHVMMCEDVEGHAWIPFWKKYQIKVRIKKDCFSTSICCLSGKYAGMLLWSITNQSPTYLLLYSPRWGVLLGGLHYNIQKCREPPSTYHMHSYLSLDK